MAVAMIAGVAMSACAGVSNDVRNAPAATSATETSLEVSDTPPVSDTGSTSLLPSAGDALWTTSEVIDGDTIHVNGPEGEQTVRMIGINAPERGECFYDQATAALGFSLGDRSLRLVRDVSETDQYGRLLRYVELADGTDVGAALVEGGFVRSHRYEPDVSRNREYDALQTLAEDAGLGLWASDACGEPFATTASIAVDGQYNAPGDDNFNLNEEWVRFTNNSASAIDLTGWRVADESSRHRYQFGDLTIAPGGSVTLYTGCGSDTPTERYWCNKDSAVWNNGGDTVFLQDPNGNNVVAETYRG